MWTEGESELRNQPFLLKSTRTSKRNGLQDQLIPCKSDPAEKQLSANCYLPYFKACF